jgi:hypothetical protein
MNPIEMRKSTRTFEQRALSPDLLEKIQTYINESENLTGPYGSQFKIELLQETNLTGNENIGTYGVIKNAQGFMVGSSINDPVKLFEFGFVFEGLVLHLTTLGVGTCWLGGTFNRQKLRCSIPLSEQDIIPAISPMGYIAERQNFKAKAMRRVLKSNQRKPMDQLFFFETFEQPIHDQAELYQQALHYVRIGPSAMNKQPWRLLVSKDLSNVHFYSTRAEANSKSFACPPELLDLGIAYRHFKEGMDSEGLSGEVRIEDPQIRHPEELEYITTWHRD